MIRVLLISPLDPEVPGNLKYLMGGENTFTRTLLFYPPKGVEYIHHSQALAKGLIEYLPMQKILSTLVKFRILPISSGSQCFRILADFDLIHCHSYSLKINQKIPVVLSDSSSNFLFLRDYLKWPSWRIKLGLALRKRLFEYFGVSDPDVNLSDARKLVVFSRFSAKIHQDLGAPGKKIEVIHPGLPAVKISPPKVTREINILFVGVWFERKGGHLLLSAFKVLARKYANIRLTILGPVPKKYELKDSDIAQKDFVPYKELVERYYPRADIFVLVPPLAEGYGLVVAEAASFAIPAIVSNVYALPELVEDGKTGYVVEAGNVDELVEKLEVLICDKNLRQKMGEAARKRFLEKFSIEKSNEKLLEVYQQALH